ncbi:sulfatase family protein [Novipirellula sp. SH528]|uniref:sulfatase family protein n=1 Tax=Novipirellula sp. SH528 TaxID=3454466 RepID=UPI003F9FB7AB
MHMNQPLVLLTTLMFVAVTPVSAAERPVNVLLITADDLGLQLNCYGDQTVPTTNLDQLASESVRFETAYVAQASCSPSRSAMLTGIYPHGNGHYGLANAGVGFQVRQQLIEQSIPNQLKRIGYRTGVIGKLHVNPEAKFAFDMRAKDGFGQRDIRKQVGHAERFWKDSGETPWFLMFNVFDPHVMGKRGSGEPDFPDVVMGVPETPIGPEDVTAWPWQAVDTPVTRKRISGYYNCVQRVDAAIGMLMQSLERTEQRKRTLIIFLGDHGPPFSRGKTTCYEAGLRVPFLIDWPGVTVPHVSKRLVSAVDIAPTVFDAVGVRSSTMVHGKSLREVATISSSESNSKTWRETLVGEFHFHGAGSFHPTRAITDGRYKLIHRLPGSVGKPIVSVDGDRSNSEREKLSPTAPCQAVYQRLQDPPTWELYDLQVDPYEFNNRSGAEAFSEVETSLRSALSQWQETTSDPFREKSFSAEVSQRYVK